MTMNNIKKNTVCRVCVSILFMICIIWTLTETAECQEQVLAVTNVKIHPVTRPVIDSGTMLVRDGKILAVGGDVSIPSNARVIDAKDMHVMPGIVESHSHMGQKLLWLSVYGSDNNELSKPINSELRAIDGLNTNDRGFAIALEGGITTMNIITGSRSPSSGQAVVVKLRGGTADEMYFAHGGMKFAIRATTRRRDFPNTIEEVGHLLRRELKATQEYMKAWDGYESGNRKGEPPARDLKLEALSKVLTREWIVGVHAHREEEMRIPMELKTEFNIDVYIIHGNAVTVLAEELAELKIPISYGPVFPGGGRENEYLEGPVQFNRLGGLISFHQDHPDGHQYYLRSSASLFVRKGMSKEDALRALTINPAKLLRLDNRIGSLEPGKDADFLILRGPPLEFESLVERVFVEGKEVYNRNTGHTVFRSL